MVAVGAAILAFLLSAIIECTASGAALPDSQISICTSFSILQATAEGGSVLMKWIGIAIGAFVLIYIIQHAVRKEGGTRDRLRELSGWTWIHGINRLKKSATDGVISKIPIVGHITRAIKSRRGTPAGKEPQIFQENRRILQVASNYAKRLQIFFGKLGAVSKWKQRIEGEMGQIKQYMNYDNVKDDFRAYKVGGTTSDGQNVNGWCGNRCDEVKGILDNVNDVVNRAMNPTNPDGLKGEDLRQAATKITAKITGLTGAMSKDYTEFSKRKNVFGNHNAINAGRMEVLDQYNASGEPGIHFYKFIKKDDLSKGAKIVTEDDDGKEENATNSAFGDSSLWTKDKDFKAEVTEVDLRGRFIDDLQYNLEIDYGIRTGDKIKVKRVKDAKRWIKDHPLFNRVLEWVDHDWEGFVKDLRYGTYHQHSRALMDYANAYDKAIPNFNDKKTYKTTGNPNESNPAFDRNMLVDPGMFTWVGRKKYNMKEENVKGGDNPFPTFSTRGIKGYLRKIIEKDMQDNDEASKWMSLYSADTGQMVAKGEEEHARICGTLGAK